MKFATYTLCFSIFLVHVNSITFQEAKKHVAECLQELKITRAQFAMARMEKSANLNCLAACIMKKRESLKDGQIDEEKLLAAIKRFNVLEGKLTDEKVKECVATANAEKDECLVARQVLDCMLQPSA